MEGRKSENQKVNQIGEIFRGFREYKGYSQEEICDGICSVATYSRIEAGERIVDFIMLEQLMNRMKIRPNEYEVYLDKKEFEAYEEREEIDILITRRNFSEAEERLKRYEAKNRGRLHQQFVLQRLADVKSFREDEDEEEIIKLYRKALEITMPQGSKKIQEQKPITKTEISCLTELARRLENPTEKEKALSQLLDYVIYQEKKDRTTMVSYYRVYYYVAMEKFKLGQYDEVIQLCNTALDIMYRGTNVENRGEFFYLRGMAYQRLGKKEEAYRDFMTAFYVFKTFDVDDVRSKKIQRELENGSLSNQ